MSDYTDIVQQTKLKKETFKNAKERFKYVCKKFAIMFIASSGDKVDDANIFIFRDKIYNWLKKGITFQDVEIIPDPYSPNNISTMCRPLEHKATLFELILYAEADGKHLVINESYLEDLFERVDRIAEASEDEQN